MEKKHSHLTLDERIVIEQGIKRKMSFSAIAASIGKDRSTVSREVQRNRKRYPGSAYMGRTPCKHTAEDCPVSRICQKCFKRTCYRCEKQCGEKCKDYKRALCPSLEKAPYVCNACRKKNFCTSERYFYDAKHANERYRDILVSSREGVNLTEDERLNLEAIVADGLRRGLSPYQIILQNGGEEGLGICEKTFYTYINSGIFDGINRLDLRSRMYKPRKKNIERMCKKDKLCLNGRRYEDYLEYMAAFPAGAVPSVVEMDSVVGRAGADDYCLLTLHFTSCNFQLAYVREKNTCESVEKVFKWLYETLEHEDFTALFPVILTDNGSEFSDPNAIEFTSEGTRRTYVFYTHPNSSFEKGSCERNHEFIRYVIPKGTELRLSQSKARLMMSHINSLARKSLNGRSPIQMFKTIYGEAVLQKLGIVEIPAKELLLKPALIKD